MSQSQAVAALLVSSPAIVAVGWTDDELAAGIQSGDLRRGSGPPLLVRQSAPGRDDAGLRLGAPAPTALLVTKEVAAETLSMSVDSLERHVMADLRTVRVGGMVRIPTRELERWVNENAARALASER